MIRRTVLALVTLSALACGKQTFLAAAFIQTPELPNPADPNGTIPSFQVMTAYLGTIDIRDPTKIDASKIGFVTGAAPSVSFRHTASGEGDHTENRVLGKDSHWTESNGTYTLSSKDEPLLTFEKTPYTLVIQEAGEDGDAYGARFVPADPAGIKQFDASTARCHVDLGGGATYDAPRCIDTTAATLASNAFTIDRTDTAAGQTPLPAFVLVGQIDPSKPTAEPTITYKTVPETAEKLLKFVLSDRDYRLNSFVIPSTAFPQTGYYVVALLVIKQGKVSGNAFIGSTALAGTGAAGIVHVQ